MAITKLNSLAIPDNTIVEADLSYPLTNFSSTGIDDNASSTAVTIDSSQRVGIGNPSPAMSLDIVAANNSQLRIDSSDANPTTFFMDYNGGGATNRIRIRNDAGDLAFLVSNTVEAMRIDSSANVLVGQDTGDSSDVGHIINPVGIAFHIRDGGVPLVLDRQTSDGDLTHLRRDGIVIGRLGVTGGDILYLTCESHGIKINSDAARIDPSDGSGNSTDGQLDLGTSSARFKDIHLSGGINFSANSNASGMTSELLDDYEEGTWTPAITGTAGIPSVTYSHRSAYYIKTGNSVIARWGMRIGSISGGSGTIRITGLPYTGKNYGSYQQSACFSNSQGLTTDADGPVLFYVEDGQSTMQGRLMTNSDTVLPLSYFQAGSWCIGTIIYDVA